MDQGKKREISDMSPSQIKNQFVKHVNKNMQHDKMKDKIMDKIMEQKRLAAEKAQQRKELQSKNPVNNMNKR